MNLALELLGRRTDGYHEIATVMQAVDLSDRIVLEDAESLELRTTAARRSRPTASNLAPGRGVALREAAGIERGARHHARQADPGRGRARAAGRRTRRRCCSGSTGSWGLRWPLARLAEVAVTLGMDVPFFLRGGVALGTGRGEKLDRIDGVALALVLVNPRYPLEHGRGVRPGRRRRCTRTDAGPAR